MKQIRLKPVFVIVGALLIVACASNDERGDAGTVRPLEVPPDLSLPQTQPAITLPDPQSASGGFRAQVQPVLPKAEKASMHRAGGERWVSVEAKPERVWTLLREFVIQSKLPMVMENPAIGSIETDWVQSNADVHGDVVQKYLGKVAPGMFSTGLKDKFRFRVERIDDTHAEVFVSHRGLEEVVREAGAGYTKTIWQPRPSDRTLEAEMLQRFMQYLGSQDTQALVEHEGVTVAKDATGVPALVFAAPVAETWRRIGVAADRAELALEGFDRARGLYRVQYRPAAEKRSRWAKWFNKDTDTTRSLLVRVEPHAKGSQVQILTPDGKADKSPAATTLLSALQAALA